MKHNSLKYFLLLFLIIFTTSTCFAALNDDTKKIITDISAFKSRQTGSNGAEKTVQYIENYFTKLGFAPQEYLYQVPVKKVQKSTIKVAGQEISLRPFFYNAITPESSNGLLAAPAYYVGKGSLKELDGIPILDSIILIDFNSARNWKFIASLGAKAVIYLAEGSENRFQFEEKTELTPLQLPCYWLEKETAEKLFANSIDKLGLINKQVQIFTEISWQNCLVKNVYTFIKGTDAKKAKELLILEAFYDNKELVHNFSPGADSSISISSLLKTAKELSENPPERSVLLLATSGNNQNLAGMRDAMWSIATKSKMLKAEKKRIKSLKKDIEQILDIIGSLSFPLEKDIDRDKLISSALQRILSKEIDQVTRKLINLRLEKKSPKNKEKIKSLAKERLRYKQLSWVSFYHDMQPYEKELFMELLPEIKKVYKKSKKNIKTQKKAYDSAMDFRKQVKEYDIAASISFHLSGHGNGVGAFHRGFLYPLKASINRTGIYSRIADLLDEAGLDFTGNAKYQQTLRPSVLRSWDSWFLDQPGLGGEVSSMAGLIGLSLVTTGDARMRWGTPSDTLDKLDWNYIDAQNKLISALVQKLSSAGKLHNKKFPRKGFSELTGRSNLLLQGELFASYPATESTILAYQGLKKYYAMVDTEGYFRIKGFADKKNVSDKLILEGYKFDKKGLAVWAIDKKDTGKRNYRIKVMRKAMKTDLTMFTCQQTTIFNLLEPRNLNFMTKIQLYDGRRDAPPRHYWYSRIDTRKSSLCSIFTEPGTPIKLTLSDTVITNKMLLTNSQEDKKGGIGFNNSKYDKIPATTLVAAKDAWALLGPRIANLEEHGIFDVRINDLRNRGLNALEKATNLFADLKYFDAWEEAGSSLALATRVYTAVEQTQKDVLFGVLFYIALFVPFAFVMERFLFNYVNIYQRIVAFCGILTILIAIIYNVHPAFNLAFSPLIIILAFFIIGLSFLVTLIIFFRFEKEMINLQNRANHYKPEEISRWKAFVVAFFLGVSNLRRRRLRTILTCITLIILTFTIMSFTTIKSGQKHIRLPVHTSAPYHGVLLKKFDWQTMPPLAADIFSSNIDGFKMTAPRIWLEEEKPTRPVNVPMQAGNIQTSAAGLIGLSVNEPEVTGLDKVLVQGSWFTDNNKNDVIIPKEIALTLGVNVGDKINIWGIPFYIKAIFSSEKLDKRLDLDGEPLTPVIFPEESNRDVSDAEQDAIEAGDDTGGFQSRYVHINSAQTIIIPANTLLAAGGNLKNIALIPKENSSDYLDTLASKLVDRFTLLIFTGDKDGVWLYNSSDTISYSGVPNIIIPLLISIFIVLNTMISSVHERRGEIGVYTSIGLAPSHVAFLFIAEALALAVISVVTGYLVAQVSASFLADTPLWAGITVNYSSLAGVAAMFLVILVVLISVIYPAKVAATIAIPDVNRTFKLPSGSDNEISVALPFLLKTREMNSLGGFLFSYFNAHHEVSHGLFSTDFVQLNQEKDAFYLSSKLWLAPFDLGIMQNISISFLPSKDFVDEDFLEIAVQINREAGEAAAWRRINTAFFHELRKQLLIWRSIDADGHKENEVKFAENIRPIRGDHE
ncbi:MAG: peptide ABC transporter permease [Desulfotalea sp.]